MAVTITDNRTIANEADATTSWTGSPTLFTADPEPVEATGCIGYVVSTATVDAYVTISSTNLTGRLIYVWVLPRGAMDTRANGGVAIHVGDGTNRMAYHLAGSDVAAFRHDDGPVAWQCLVLDQSNLPAQKTTRAGSEGSLNWSAITQIGAMFKTLAKSTGGVSNCWVDIVRYGDPSANDGAMITITAGTSGDTGKFSEIATADRSTANQNARGVVRQLGAGAYGVQGALRFGDRVGTTASFFADTNATVIFESRGLATTRYGIVVVGNATGSTTFKLGLKSGTGDAATGTDGCTLFCPSGVGAVFDASHASLQFCLIYGSTISGFSRGVTLSSNATNGPNHEFCGNTLSACGIFDPGRAIVRNCRITGWTGANTDAALLWGANADIGRCSLTSSGTGHGVKMTSAGTYTFNGITFSGYAGSNGSTGNEALYNACTPTTAGSYSETNQDTTQSLRSGSNTALGQSFANSSALVLSACRFYLKKTGSPTGNAVCKIYAHSGSLGSTSVPTGAALATSATLDVSTLTTSYALTEFKFTGSNNITLSASTNYVVVIEYSGGSVGNTLDVGTDASSPGAGGNVSTFNGSWTAVAGQDACFYVYTNGALTINVTGGGSTPTFRNALGCSTTVNSNVSVTLTGLKNPTEVRVYSTGTATEVAGQENVTSGSFNFGVGAGVGVDISIIALGYQNMRLVNFSTTADTSIPISQQVDRQYANP